MANLAGRTALLVRDRVADGAAQQDADSLHQGLVAGLEESAAGTRSVEAADLRDALQATPPDVLIAGIGTLESASAALAGRLLPSTLVVGLAGPEDVASRVQSLAEALAPAILVGLRPATSGVTGRCVAALAMDPDIAEKRDGLYGVAGLAPEYRFTDPDQADPSGSG